MRLEELFEKQSMNVYRIKIEKSCREFINRLHAGFSSGHILSRAVVERSFAEWMLDDVLTFVKDHRLSYQSVDGPHPIPLEWVSLTMNGEETFYGMYQPVYHNGAWTFTFTINFPAVLYDEDFWKLPDVERKKEEIVRRITGTFIHELNHYLQAVNSGVKWMDARHTQYAEKIGKDHLAGHITSNEIDSYAIDVAAALRDLVTDRLYGRKDILTMLKTTEGVRKLGEKVPHLKLFHDLWIELMNPSPYLKERPDSIRIGKQLYGSFMKKVLFHFEDRNFRIHRISYKKPKSTLKKWISALLGAGK